MLYIIDKMGTEMINHILQVNLKNKGGAFSIIYETGKVIYPEYVFDYFSDEPFIHDDVYQYLLTHDSKVFDKKIKGNRIFKQIKLVTTFYKVVKDGSYKVVHINSDTAWKACLYLFAANKANIYITIVHSHSSGINGHFRLFNYFLHRTMRFYIAHKCSYKCACSTKAAEWMFGNAEGVTIVHNGVDINKYHYNEGIKKELVERLNIKKDCIIIGTVGDYSFAKNPEFLYQIIHELKNNTKFIFVLIGQGKGKKVILEKARREGIENIVDIGQVTNVENYLSLIDIFILPSRFEGVPMSALEAQACGCYTLVSNNVTPETLCSKHYESIKLEVGTWIDKIYHINLNYDRNNIHEYLDQEKISIDKAGNQLMTLYKERLPL